MEKEFELYHTICTECGTPMNEGYCIWAGMQYYCTDKCLHANYTQKEWKEMYKDGGDNYWTEWYEDDANYKLLDGKLIKISA